MKKLSEESEQNSTEPHSLAVLFKVYLLRGYMAKTYCFLHSIGQLAMSTFFVKYMFAILPTKE